jgi:endonuclease/exonuclease/phosphatase family metal-dependent hydrolase
VDELARVSHARDLQHSSRPRLEPHRIDALRVCHMIDADIARSEVVGASPLKPGQAAQLGAALGMAGSWRRRVTQHGAVRERCSAVSDASSFSTIDVENVRHRSVQRVDLALDDDTLHFYNVHWERHSSAAPPGRQARLGRSRSAYRDRSSLAISTSGRGIAKDILAERLQSIDLTKHLSRKRTYPGFFPILHLDHIYYEGKVEVMKVTMPRDRMTLMASDHLPLVADLKIGFD